MTFEIVQTGPEGEGKQPYFLRHTGANNSDKIVKSENYAHRAGAEGAYIAIARDFIPTADEGAKFEVVWNEDRTKAYLHVNDWIGTHQAIRFVKEFPKAAKKAAATEEAGATTK